MVIAYMVDFSSQRPDSKQQQILISYNGKDDDCDKDDWDGYKDGDEWKLVIKDYIYVFIIPSLNHNLRNNI